MGGSSYLNYVAYGTGLMVSGADNAGVVLSSSGLSSSPVLLKDTTGNVWAKGKASDGSATSTKVPIPTTGSSTRRVFWRELVVDK